MGCCLMRTDVNAGQSSENTSFDELFLSRRHLSDGATCSVELVQLDTSHPLFNLLMTQPQDPHQLDPCIMKKVHLSEENAFRREVAALTQIDHPHIVKCLGHVEQPDSLFIFQEYYAGNTLAELISVGPLSDDKAAFLTAQLLDALGYLHRHDIVHRDIKPANIMLATRRLNRIVLIDFGYARKVSPADEFSDWTGTPEFLAPESILKEKRIAGDLKKMDVWAVGVCVFQMLTARLPFRCDGEGEKGLMRAVCYEDVAYPEEMSKAAKSFTRALLNKKSVERPSAADALRHEWVSKFGDAAVEEEHPDPEMLDETCVSTGGVNVADW